MKIGIIGAGNIGKTAADLFARAGHRVAMSNSRGPETLRDTAEELGPNVTAMTAQGAAEFGEVVLEAVPFGKYRELPADILSGKILISALNYYPERDGDIDLQGQAQTELVAKHVSGARVVKAFNTIFWKHLHEQGDASLPLSERRTIFIAGDDADAQRVVSDLIEALGFAALDTGALAESTVRTGTGLERLQPRADPERSGGDVGAGVLGNPGEL